MLIMVPVVVLLCYLIYKYNLNSRTLEKINNMNYKKSLELSKLPNCYEVDASMQYKLCDYYISSSYMTPCIGNQHYDYVSIDMIVEVLQSGARYIQLPICEADISQQAIPVIGTAQYGQKVITSFNTLDIKSVCHSIRNSAFKINNQKINYPLIIHLILNTNNPYTLNVLANNIEASFSDLLPDVNKYNKMPIFLERLCNLLGKVIIFATPEYQGTVLEKWVIPMKNMMEEYVYSELDGVMVNKDTAYTGDYNNKLSAKQQMKNEQVFKSKYPSLDYVIKNSDMIGQNILNDKDLLNNLKQFNKIGMTVIKPHDISDVLSQNYNVADAVYFGCQIIAMNFQVNDDNMKNYLEIFKKNSFVLKPGSMRYTDKEVESKDIMEIYNEFTVKNLHNNANILNEIYYKYNNILIALESLVYPGTYLTKTDNNLSFLSGTVIVRDNGVNRGKIGVEQCFVVMKSIVGTGGEDIPLFLASAVDMNLLITLNGNMFDLEKKTKTKENLYKQSVYFEKSKVIDNTNGGQLVSIRMIDVNNVIYLGCENKKTKAYPSTGIIEAINNMSYILHVIPFNIQIKMITLYDGSVKVMGGGILGVLENNMVDGTGFILEPVERISGKNFDWKRDQFYLKNAKTNTYVIYDTNTLLIYDKSVNPNNNSIFSLVLLNGYYVLKNSVGQNMILFENNLLKFVDESLIVSNENLFKIELEYILLN